METIPFKKNINSLPDSDQILFAPQKYAVAGYKYGGAGIRYLATWGMAPCVGFAAYEPQSKSGVVAHFDSDATDATSEFYALNVGSDLCRQLIKGSGNNSISVTIVHGSSPDGTSTQIANLLSKATSGFGATADVVQSQTGDFAMSLNTGKLVGFHFSQRNEQNPEKTAQMWFSAAITLRKSSGGQIDVYKIRRPLMPASTFDAA